MYTHLHLIAVRGEYRSKKYIISHLTNPWIWHFSCLWVNLLHTWVRLNDFDRGVSDFSSEHLRGEADLDLLIWIYDDWGSRWEIRTRLLLSTEKVRGMNRRLRCQRNLQPAAFIHLKKLQPELRAALSLPFFFFLLSLKDFKARPRLNHFISSPNPSPRLPPSLPPASFLSHVC